MLVALLSCSKTARSDDGDSSGEGAAAAAPAEVARSMAGATPRPEPELLRLPEGVASEGAAADLEDSLAEVEETGTLTVVSSTGRSEVIALGKSKIADTGEYTVTVEVPGDAAAGKTSSVKLVITPKSGWKLNQDFPTKLTVTPPPGVSVAKPTQKREDAEKFSEKLGAFAVAFSPSSGGKKKFGAQLRFAVCTESTCDPKTANLAWAVAVK